MFAKYFTILEEKLFNSNVDPLVAQKKMVNSIQQLVGIRNVFGDKGIRSESLKLWMPRSGDIAHLWAMQWISY